MKKIYFSLICGVLCFASLKAQSIATFEDLNLATETYWDGSDGTGSFISGSYEFINNFTDWGGYTSWDGFAYSSMTSTNFEGLADQYNSCVGKGNENSQTFGIIYYSSFMGTEPTVKDADGKPFDAIGCYVTNSAYAYTSMLYGDAYAKQFDDNDWFMITATGYVGGEVTGTAEFYLAKEGKIIDTWQYMDLKALGTVDEIHFTLSSSDTGDWGMNTPAYFCMDDFGAESTGDKLKIIKTARNDERVFDLMGRNKKPTTGIFFKNGQAYYAK